MVDSCHNSQDLNFIVIFLKKRQAYCWTVHGWRGMEVDVTAFARVKCEARMLVYLCDYCNHPRGKQNLGQRGRLNSLCEEDLPISV